MGRRQRYVLIDKRACLAALGNPEESIFQENYRRLIDETITRDRCRRQAEWTESIAVGSESFIGQIRDATEGRRRFETQRLDGEAWALRELPSGPELESLKPKNEAKNWL